TSVTFAGSEAIASYRRPLEAGRAGETGGLIVNEGSGWHPDPGVDALLASLGPSPPVLTQVAGLPDGGAVAAGPGIVIDRDSAAARWRMAAQPLPEAENISALAALREGGEVRALVSIDTYPQSSPEGPLYTAIDNPTPSSPGQPLPLIAPDP